MIVFYSDTCEDCAGNHALMKMKSHCKKKGVEFEERRTVLWVRFEEEAQEIMDANKGLKLPFFYATECDEVLSGFSLTPLDTLEALIKKEKKAIDKAKSTDDNDAVE